MKISQYIFQKCGRLWISILWIFILDVHTDGQGYIKDTRHYSSVFGLGDWSIKLGNNFQ